MEAATVPATAAVPRQRLREFLGKYGLIIVLLALPVICALGDLLGWGHVAFIEMSNEKSLTRLGTNIKDGISNGSMHEFCHRCAHRFNPVTLKT